MLSVPGINYKYVSQRTINSRFYSKLISFGKKYFIQIQCARENFSESLINCRCFDMVVTRLIMIVLEKLHTAKRIITELFIIIKTNKKPRFPFFNNLFFIFFLIN